MTSAAEPDCARRELLALCRRWSTEIAPLAAAEERRGYFRRELPGLLGRPALFRDLLGGLRRGGGFPDTRVATMFDNELLLYQDPGRAFSLRMFLFGPGERTPVHDHGAWGVLGSAFGPLEVVRYRLEPAAAGPGRLAAEAPRVLAPGAIEETLPYDAGIHRTGNPDAAGATIMVNIYGAPGRRPYLRFFDPSTGSETPVYPPRRRKLLLAELALAAMDAAGG